MKTCSIVFLGVAIVILVGVSLAGIYPPKQTPVSESVHPIAPAVADLTEATWPADVLESPAPVLVVFSAKWCGACKAYTPTVETVAGRLLGKVMVGKVDTDKEPGLSRRYAVRSLPTTILLVAGEEKGRFVGGKGEEAVLEFVRRRAP